MEGWRDVWVCGWVGGWRDGGMEGWRDGFTAEEAPELFGLTFLFPKDLP